MTGYLDAEATWGAVLSLDGGPRAIEAKGLDDVFLTLTGHAAERPFLHDTDGAAGVHGKETA